MILRVFLWVLGALVLGGIVSLGSNISTLRETEADISDAEGHFTINIAPRARPGNWLPTGGIERFVLVWRLYDTPIGVATRTTKEGPMPAIVEKSCS